MMENKKNEAKANIMVCVTRQRTCDRLISRGENLKIEYDGKTELLVVHCVHTGHNFLGTPYEGEALEYLFTAAQLAGAELCMLRADDVDDALVDYAETHDVRTIVMGAAPEQGENIITRLQRRLPDVEFDIVG